MSAYRASNVVSLHGDPIYHHTESTPWAPPQGEICLQQISDHIAFIDKGQMVTAGGKEELLDRWRRLQIRVPAGATAPALPGVVKQQASGQIHVVIVNQPVEDLDQRCQAAGCALLAVDPLTLEEIFVAAVTGRRNGGLA